MTKSDDYLWDRSGDADPEVARLEELMSPLRNRAPLDELRLRRPKRSRIPMYAALVVAVAAVLALVVFWPKAGPVELACAGTTGFKFTAQGGNVSCGTAQVASGELPIGTTLDTGANEAVLAIATIGNAQLGTKTRVRLDRTGGSGHQLHLEQGRMHATVNAAPRIFAVTTPGANVTDLGCEYTLDIDATGAGSLHVITGKVELAGEGRLVVVPHGTKAHLLAGRRAGVLMSARATPQLDAAVRDYENNVAGALARLLAAATAEDSITLWDLAVSVSAAQRRQVLERLDDFIPGPQGLTIDEALADPVMFEMWVDEARLRHLSN